ncbi:MAG: transposase [Acholeplasmatales bacterium]|nr:transposase [Acholeplasmatales bacterium]
MKFDTNNHSVFSLNYHLVMVVKYRRKVINDVISDRLKDTDIVSCDGKIIEKFPFSYYLYNKPRGILSMISNKPESYMNNIDVKTKLMVAGRLDKDSEGLLILTNDPEFLNQISGNKTIYDKEYLVKLKYEITSSFIEKMNGEFEFRNKKTKPIKFNMIDNYNFKIILNEGMYHQIRKMVIESGNRVDTLKRIRIGKYILGDMQPGEIKKIDI